MQVTQFNDGRTYELDEGWQQVSLAGSEWFTFGWFEKPPDHSSSMHDHESEQAYIAPEDELTIHTETGSATLSSYDSIHFDVWGEHRVANRNDERAVGPDVFAPGHFDLWMEGEE